MTEQSAPWNRSIVALLVGIFCTTAAALVAVTALGKQLYDATGEPIHLGLLGLAEFAPSALLVLVTGALADRFDRARISAASAAGQGIAGIGLALYTATQPRSVWPIYGLVLLFGAGRAFLAPANRALPADMVAPEQVPSLMARRAVAWQSAIIVGPVVGGFLYAADPVAPYVAMAAFLGVATGAMLLIHTGPPRPSEPVEEVPDPVTARPVPVPVHSRLREALEGLRFVRRTPILLGAISLDLFAVLFGGAVALLPALATDRLGVGAVGLGWLRAAGGIGAAATSILIARWPLRSRVGPVLIACVSIFGAFTIVLGVTRTFAVAFVAMAVLSGADAVSVYIRSTLVPLATPPDKRGRVIAVESVFIGASNELGAFESGVTGQLLGAPLAVVVGGVATLGVAAAYWLVFPTLREVDRFPAPRA